MSKYLRGIEALNEGKDWVLTAHGNSMMPLLKSGSDLTFRKTDDYKVGDVVLSKVNGRWIGAHKITRVSGERYMISNNKGHDNGWTKKVYGRVIALNGEPFGRNTKS